MFLSMLQYIYIHVEASNTMDQKPSHQKPCAKTMHKTIGMFAPPNIGSQKKIPWGAAPDPVERSYPPPSNPL